MSLDIKYRPRNYEDVLGQESIIAILRQYVAQGRGFQQSYLFCGGFGSGKTTLGRILARALLCESPKSGDPCNECSSCRGMLENGTSSDFTEVDAATNSGKADVKSITDLIQYDTFSGKRRIYLFDESHQLSRDALDALLKPLEETMPGSDDKRLVCIFCTTEPEKMRATVLSRCAPAFVIQQQSPETIAHRLQQICSLEDIAFDPEMLLLIAEITECHIRDALKAVEGVSMLGGVTQNNVRSYLHLDLNSRYLDVLDAIGTDLQVAYGAVKDLLGQVSPVTCYEKLAEISMLAFRASLGGGVAGHWGKARLVELGVKGTALLGYASRFASRPGRPTAAMLMMDIAQLHYVGGSVVDSTAVIHVGVAASVPPTKIEVSPSVPALVVDVCDGIVPEQDRLWVQAQKGPATLKHSNGVESARPVNRLKDIICEPDEFAELLGQALAELRSGDNGGPS